MAERRGIVIVGASGIIGRALVARLSDHWDVTGTHHRSATDATIAFDLGRDDPAALPVDWSQQRAVVVAGAVTSLLACEDEPAASRAVNVEGPRRMFEHAAAHGATPIFLSTTAVLPGDLHQGAPRRPDERATPAPTLQYGIQKLAAETAMPTSGLILRLTKVSAGFVHQIAARLRAGEPMRAATDQHLSLLSARDVARIIEWAIEHGLAGLHHVAAPPVRSRYEWCVAIARRIDADESLVEACRLAEFDSRWPRDASLDGQALASRLPFNLEDGDSQIARLLTRRESC